MSSLKEIKGRINSVRSTEKITSAMRMVSTAKLRKTQGKAAVTLAYAQQLHDIVDSLRSSLPANAVVTDQRPQVQHVTLVAVSSSSGLCGAFNSNVWKALKARIQEYKAQGIAVSVIPLGKKVAHELLHEEYEYVADYITVADDFTAQPSAKTQAPIVTLIRQLQSDFEQGKTDRVEIIYTHFKSMGTQVVSNYQFLPYTIEAKGECTDKDYIVEPSPAEMYSHTLPLLQQTEFLALLLDAATAEHASRMLAMQTADDNAQDLLSELTLLYNKTRQQSITNELIDIMSGAQR